jgi:predicted alpha/beta hydrolase family esterase
VNWKKLRSGLPWHDRKEIDGSKMLMFHAKDDPNVPYERTREFSRVAGAKLKSLSRAGHISADYVVRRYWVQIKKFFESV